MQSVLAVSISLGLALLAVLIIDYLNRVPPQAMPAPLNLGGIHLHHQPRAILEVKSESAPLGFAPVAALPVDAPAKRIMNREEILYLYQSAEPITQLIMALLLNGLTLQEILTLQSEHLDIRSLMIVIPGRRNIMMTQQVAQWLSRQPPPAMWPALEDIETLICCAAIDSGLANPEQINAETLRYSYMLYLVGQGIKLSDLTKIVGPLPPNVLLELGRFSPERASVPLELIQLDYL